MTGKLKNWIRRIAKELMDEQREEWRKESAGPLAVDGELEDALLLCYAWDNRILSAEETLRRANLWMDENFPPGNIYFGNIYFGWSLHDLVYSSKPSYQRPRDTMRPHVRRIIREANAIVKAAEHKAAQKALKEGK